MFAFGCEVLECLPLEYMSIVSQVKCILLTLSLSVLLAGTQSNGDHDITGK